MTQHTEPIYFVWIKTNGKLAPQKWYGDKTTGTGKFKHGAVDKEGPLVFFVTLPKEQEELSLNDLIKLYPYEEKSE